MAILLIKIEDEKSLAFNEFFDYGGYCYATSRSRLKPGDKVIDMTSFYDAAVNTKTMHDIPVIFVSEEEKVRIIGWYEKAEIYSEMLTPSLFLEGNVKAYTTDSVWLPKEKQTQTIHCFMRNQLYEVIEEEDARYPSLKRLISEYSGENQVIRYHSAEVHTIPKALQDLTYCKQACEQWAGLVTAEECQDIRDLKTLETYAKRLCQKDRKNPDGYYYLALACYHLGFVKEGLKQINKALQLEKEADNSDLIALKGLLLVSRGYVEEGAAHLQEAYEKSNYEGYLLMEGRAYMMMNKVDKAYDCFKQIEDEDMLEQMGIKLKEMERTWSSIKVRYMKLKEMFLVTFQT